VLGVHMPPFWHGTESHKAFCVLIIINVTNLKLTCTLNSILLLFSHNVPLKPFGQEQAKNGLESDAEHEPEFKHGFELQGA